MHILNGKGGVSMLLRWSDEEPVNAGQWELYLEQSGVGETHYQDYDGEIIAARDRLAASAARRKRDRPWALFVSYVSARIRPSRCRSGCSIPIPRARLPLPPLFRPHERPAHPAIEHLRRIWAFRR